MDLPCLIGLFLFLIVQCDGKPEIGDYIVDCLACKYFPFIGVDSYSCSVRCEAQGEVSVNLTTLYDIVAELSNKLDSVTRELEEAQRKLNIEVMFSVQLINKIAISPDQKVIFDNVTSNVGNGYDSATGTFTVPYNGSYELTLRNMGQPGVIYTYIMRDGLELCTAHGVGTDQQGMCTIRQKLVAGDEICGEEWKTKYLQQAF